MDTKTNIKTDIKRNIKTDPAVYFKANEIPSISTVGKFHVDKPWYHINRTQHLNCMIFVTNGEMNVTEDNIDYKIRKGQIFFLKADLHHFGKEITPVQSEWFWVSFFPYEDKYEEKIKYEDKFKDEFIRLPKQATVADMDKLMEIFCEMYELFQSSQIYKKQQIASRLQQVFYILLSQPRIDARKKSQKDLVDAVNKILKQNLYKKFESSYIEQKMHMNYSYLGKIYKENTGTTINRHFATLKIYEAVKLMKTTNMNISQISNYLNYPNPYYFSRVFKKIMGVSPQQYLKEIYR